MAKRQKLTKSLEDYLEAVLVLVRRGRVARVREGSTEGDKEGNCEVRMVDKREVELLIHERSTELGHEIGCKIIELLRKLGFGDSKILTLFDELKKRTSSELALLVGLFGAEMYALGREEDG